MFVASCLHLAIGVHLQQQRPGCFLMLSNLQSGSNIGAICRNALSFNVSEVVIVGRQNYKEKMRMADRGSKARLVFRNFPSSQMGFDYLKYEKHCITIGVEIMPTATSIVDFKFKEGANVAFVFGNEGAGLSELQRKNCDEFVYIPQYSVGMASINVACCSAIVLQTFAVQAGYQQSEIIGEKFV